MGKRCAFPQIVLEQLDRHMQKTNRKNSAQGRGFARDGGGGADWGLMLDSPARDLAPTV